MATLLIDIHDVTTQAVRGDTITLTAPEPRPGRAGGVTRPFRRLVELDADGKATVDVEPGPLRVLFHNDYGREVVIDTKVPASGDTFTLRELIVAYIGHPEDVTGIREALEQKADAEDVDALADLVANAAPLEHRHTINEIDDLRWSLDQKQDVDSLRDDVLGYTEERLRKSEIKDIPKFEQALSDKADTKHNHLSSDIKDSLPWVGAGHPAPSRLISTFRDGFMHVTLKPEIDNHVANKAYVDGEVKAVGDALESKADKSHKHLSSDIKDSLPWVGAGHPAPSRLISTFRDGFMHVTLKPEIDNHVANKGYVDEVVKVATDAVAKKQDALDIETASVGALRVTRFGPLVVAVADRIASGDQAETLPAQFRPSSPVYAALSPLASGSNDSPYLHIRTSGAVVVWNASGECRGSVAYVV